MSYDVSAIIIIRRETAAAAIAGLRRYRGARREYIKPHARRRRAAAWYSNSSRSREMINQAVGSSTRRGDLRVKYLATRRRESGASARGLLRGDDARGLVGMACALVNRRRRWASSVK